MPLFAKRMHAAYVRMGVLVYVGFFLIIGQPFDVYWGLMIAPLLALWLAHAPAGLKHLMAVEIDEKCRGLTSTPPQHSQNI